MAAALLSALPPWARLDLARRGDEPAADEKPTKPKRPPAGARGRGGRGRREAADDAPTPLPDAPVGEGPSPPEEPEPPRRTMRTYAREAAALLLIASGLYVGLALASFAADPLRPEVVGSNWVGPVGEVFAGALVRAVGVASWLLPLEIVLVARPLLVDKRVRLSVIRLSGDVLVAVIASALVYIALPAMTAFGAMPLGGAVGSLFGELLRGLFSTLGSFLIGGTVVALILVQRATFSFIELAQKVQRVGGRVRSAVSWLFARLGAAWTTAREVERRERERSREEDEPLIASPEQADAIIAMFADDGEPGAPFLPLPVVRPPADPSALRPVSSPPVAQPAVPDVTPADPVGPSPTPGPVAAGTPPSARGASPRRSDPVMRHLTDATPLVGLAAIHEATTPAPERIVLKVEPPPSQPSPPPPAVEHPRATVDAPEPDEPDATPEPRIIDTSAASRVVRDDRRRAEVEVGTSFRLPPTDLLDAAAGSRFEVCTDKLRATAQLLEKTLQDYGVQGKVEEIHPGPTVTTFEVSPAPGTKVSKVSSLADDLALGLSRQVRIIAPIPGKNRIGFEVPNERRVPVNLRELVEDRRFLDMKSPLPCVLGRDIIGKPFFADLASMPHVIVAGATGAGKSVGLNVMLVSLLYRRTPDELRMLMIDPKVVELAPFDGIPHLLFPVVTDMKQAANALKWAVDEMERRYQLFADAGTRNLKTYNQWVKRVLEGKAPAPRPVDGEVQMPAVLPYIVVVVEEFADLMMQQGKEVEVSVARLAQKARAAGMHCIVATQRPSVDVITGMIKANFPTRIAFRVSQKVDSRTILDELGAHHLLGSGDMLVKLNGQHDTHRVQCPFVSEEEVQRVTDMLRSQGAPEYDESIVLGSSDDGGGGGSGSESDPLYDRAVLVVAETQKCSTSWVQRKLGIGYNRAAKIVELMEQEGVIGPARGSKPREILVSSQ